jgi:hypothetical protein
VLKALAAGNSTASGMALSWWWQLFVEPHQVWLLVAIVVLLLVAQRRSSDERTEPRWPAGIASSGGFGVM